MKYPCNLIKDLIPLYYDKVCSEESRKIVEEHLQECSECNIYYKEMCKEDDVNLYSDDLEKQKAESFQKVKSKIRQKQIIVASIIICILLVVSFAIVGVLKKSVDIIEDDKISVSMENNNLIAKVNGTQPNYMKIKNVEKLEDEDDKTYMFFYMTDTKWDDITTSSKTYSEQVLCLSDKGADNIDEVYYYIGDYTDIENIGITDLKKIMENSKKMWSK